MKVLVALALLVLVGACSDTLTSTPGVAPLVYPISAEQADRAIADAMVAKFPDSPIAAVALPNKGYTVTIRFALDSHQISAVAIPAQGRQADGSTVPGYSFAVSHSGTIPITASNKSAALFSDIVQRAGAIKPGLPTAN